MATTKAAEASMGTAPAAAGPVVSLDAVTAALKNMTDQLAAALSASKTPAAAPSVSVQVQPEKPTPGPTERMKRCAELVKGGASVAEAMTEAGYGPSFVRGNAASFARQLASAGLLTTRQAERAFAGVTAPAATQDEED